MAFVVVDDLSLQILYIYTKPANPWVKDGRVLPLIQVPSDLDPEVVMAVQDSEGTITLQADPVKVQAKTDAQWVQVRTQQKQKLYESDWTCSVVDPPAPILAQRDQWVLYRQALRDVTTQSDPFNITWPTPPT
jgi:hypothetical protein